MLKYSDIKCLDPEPVITNLFYHLQVEKGIIERGVQNRHYPSTDYDKLTSFLYH